MKVKMVVFEHDVNNWREAKHIISIYVTYYTFITLIFVSFISLFWSPLTQAVFSENVGFLPASLTFFQSLKLVIFVNILRIPHTAKVNIDFNEMKLFWDKVTLLQVYEVLMTPIWGVLVVITGLLISLTWNWVIPDVFSQAVAMSLLPSKLPIAASLGFSMLVSLLTFKRKTRVR